MHTLRSRMAIKSLGPVNLASRNDSSMGACLIETEKESLDLFPSQTGLVAHKASGQVNYFV